MLLIDDHEPKVTENNAFLKEGMGPDEDIDSPLRAPRASRAVRRPCRDR